MAFSAIPMPPVAKTRIVVEFNKEMKELAFACFVTALYVVSAFSILGLQHESVSKRGIVYFRVLFISSMSKLKILRHWRSCFK